LSGILYAGGLLFSFAKVFAMFMRSEVEEVEVAREGESGEGYCATDPREGDVWREEEVGDVGAELADLRQDSWLLYNSIENVERS
jgi:hypothetical protein